MAGRTSRVALLRHGHEPDHRENHDEDEQGAISHGETQNRSRRGYHSRSEPRLPEIHLREKRAEKVTELLIEAERLEVHAEEGEKAGGRGCHGPECGARRCNIQRPVELRPGPGQCETDEHEGTDGGRSTEVDEEFCDREPVSHASSRVGDELSRRSAAELKSREQTKKRDQHQNGRSGDTSNPRHKTSVGDGC